DVPRLRGEVPADERLRAGLRAVAHEALSGRVSPARRADAEAHRGCFPDAPGRAAGRAEARTALRDLDRKTGRQEGRRRRAMLRLSSFTTWMAGVSLALGTALVGV